MRRRKGYAIIIGRCTVLKRGVRMKYRINCDRGGEVDETDKEVSFRCSGLLREQFSDVFRGASRNSF